MHPADDQEASLPAIDRGLFRDAMARFPTGVTVVAALDELDQPCGMTVSAFISVSLNPPLVLVSLSQGARTLRAIDRRAGFAVNVLAANQESVARLFAQPGASRFRHVSWAPGPSGLPLVDGAAAHMECKMVDRIVAGDHVLIVGDVVHIDASSAEALLHYRRGFHASPETVQRAPRVVISP